MPFSKQLDIDILPFPLLFLSALSIPFNPFISTLFLSFFLFPPSLTRPILSCPLFFLFPLISHFLFPSSSFISSIVSSLLTFSSLHFLFPSCFLSFILLSCSYFLYSLLVSPLISSHLATHSLSPPLSLPFFLSPRLSSSTLSSPIGSAFLPLHFPPSSSLCCPVMSISRAGGDHSRQ